MAAKYTTLEVVNNILIDSTAHITNKDGSLVLEDSPNIFNMLGMDLKNFKYSVLADLMKQSRDFYQKYDALIYVMKYENPPSYVRDGRKHVQSMLTRIFRNLYTKITIPKDITKIKSRYDGEFTVNESSMFIYKIYLDKEYIKSLLDPSKEVADAIKTEIENKRKECKDRAFYTMFIYEALLNIGLALKYPETFYLHKTGGSLSTSNLKGNLYTLRTREKSSLAEIIFNEMKLNTSNESLESDAVLAKSETWLLEQHFGKFKSIQNYDVVHTFTPSLGANVDLARAGLEKIKEAKIYAESYVKLLENIKEEEGLQDNSKNFGESIILYDLRHFAEFNVDNVYWRIIRKYAIMSNSEHELDEIEELEEQ